MAITSICLSTAPLSAAMFACSLMLLLSLFIAIFAATELWLLPFFFLFSVLPCLSLLRQFSAISAARLYVYCHFYFSYVSLLSSLLSAAISVTLHYAIMSIAPISTAMYVTHVFVLLPSLAGHLVTHKVHEESPLRAGAFEEKSTRVKQVEVARGMKFDARKLQGGSGTFVALYSFVYLNLGRIMWRILWFFKISYSYLFSSLTLFLNWEQTSRRSHKIGLTRETYRRDRHGWLTDLWQTLHRSRSSNREWVAGK